MLIRCIVFAAGVDVCELYTGLFKTIVGVIHNTLQMQPHMISFYGVTSRIRFMLLLFPQVSRNWRYEWEVKGKHANAVGSQYPSHYLGTRCIQHYHRWCRTPRLPAVDWTDALTGRFKWTRPFGQKTKSGFCACDVTFQLTSTAGMPSHLKCGLLFVFPFLHSKDWPKQKELIKYGRIRILKRNSWSLSPYMFRHQGCHLHGFCEHNRKS